MRKPERARPHVHATSIMCASADVFVYVMEHHGVYTLSLGMDMCNDSVDNSWNGTVE
jgi:hypothetical protein